MIRLHNISVAGALSALLLLFVSCERTAEPDLVRLGWAYYPLKQGQFRLYDVYRINYNFGAENDTLEYESKELVADYFLDQQGDTVYILQRLQRSSPEGSWQLDSTYLIQRTTRWLMQSVNNRPQLSLVFPVAEGRTWNTNLLNAAPADSFSMQQVGKTFTLGETIYESSLKVVQEDLVDTIVETDQREEIYAQDVGMVYKKVNRLKYCTNPECLGRNIISTGLFMEMSLKDYGLEE